ATANQLVLDAFLGRLTARDAHEGAHFLATLQLADGSYAGYPHGTVSSSSVTALVYAALHAAAHKIGESDVAALASTRAWVQAHGGVDAVVARFFSHSDQTALFLSMVGLVDADALPDPQLTFSLVPPLVDFMQLKMNAGVIMGFMSIGFITRLLRKQKSRFPIDLLWGVHELEALACRKYMQVFQNPDGNWDGNTIQSALYVAGLYASGLTLRSPRMRAAVEWLDAQKRYDERGMHMRVFTCENWMSSFALRALLRAGVARSDPRIDRGLRSLLSAQIDVDMPRVDQRKRGAARKGGWAFQPSNPTMPDSDDTGCVLSALGLALKRDDILDATPIVRGPRDGELLNASTNDLVQRAVDRALPQLLAMQAPSGGWSAFVWNLGDKAPGPMYQQPMPLPKGVVESARFFLAPPVELADPPMEDITGRVLVGLGAVGFKTGSPAVQNAISFLDKQRAHNGVWWGRWLVNYLAGTASIVSGLAAVRSKDEPVPQWWTDAVAWLLAHQNDDGGFGETPASYLDASQAGRGPSMPPLTAIVLTALLDAGCCEVSSMRAAVDRAVAYLLRTQQQDGFWPNNGWLQVMLPPDQFYEYDGERMCRPLEALALYRQHVRQIEHARSPLDRLAPLTPSGPLPITSARVTGDWPERELSALRAFGDPVADAVITRVFTDGQAQALSQVMATLVKSDDPIPAGLPAIATQYFTDTQAMPPWADPKKLAIAEGIYLNHGWAIALGLFTSSLPQAYCGANGARVLLQTGGMRGNTRRRILETAQFVFDVLNPGAFGPSGRGIRAIQKVRLMHATIRHLILVNGEWDCVGWGLPINQEDLAGTLMTFSVVILDVIASVGLVLTDEEQDAYMHLWQVAGHFMGVDPALVPRDVADGRSLMSAIRSDQWHPSTAGDQLGEALTAAMDDYLPGDVFIHLPAALVRRIAGDNVADMLGLPPAKWITDVLEAVAVVDRFIDSIKDVDGP
ncbi:MAG TPA: oxygenase MpaB family protein, partial [Myxococcota bacterium]